jgi:hypothetical protein
MGRLEDQWNEDNIAAMQRAIGRTLRESHCVDNLLDERMGELLRQLQDGEEEEDV